MGSVNSLLRISAMEETLLKGFPTFLYFPLPQLPVVFWYFLPTCSQGFLNWALKWQLTFNWMNFVKFYIFQMLPIEDKWWLDLASLWPTPYRLAGSEIFIWRHYLLKVVFVQEKKRTLLEMEHSLSCLICLICPFLNSLQNKWGGKKKRTRSGFRATEFWIRMSACTTCCIFLRRLRPSLLILYYLCACCLY